MIPKRPEKFGKIPIAGAKKRLLDRLDREEKEKREMREKEEQGNQSSESKLPVTTPANINKNEYIYVPSANLYIAKERTHKGLNWHDTHKTLHEEGLAMPTIPVFIEYINYLRGDYQKLGSNEKQEAEKILDDILTVRSPWRNEWLDARFREDNEEMYVDYNHRIDSNGELIAGNTDKLESYLMEDKIPGIDLDDWLNNYGKQGLPKLNVNSGDLYYWSPGENCVAWFVAGSDRAVLYCGWDPVDSDSSLGVFSVCEANASQ